MSAITLWHNPRCSKSRQALELLRERGAETEVVEYLKQESRKNEWAFRRKFRERAFRYAALSGQGAKGKPLESSRSRS